MLFYDSNHITMISIELLEKYNAQLKPYTKDQIIFNEFEAPKFYFQIKTGKVKMFNLTEEGKEFVQGYFDNDKSFGEPPLFGDFIYPASAINLEDSFIYVLQKEQFLLLLKENPEVHLLVTKLLCKRMIYKATIMKEVSIHPPEHRILTLLNHFKLNSKNKNELYKVSLTRQQISELTGLRVETVIRAIKKLEKANELSIIDRTVYL